MKQIETTTTYQLSVNGERVDVHITEKPGSADPHLTISGASSGYLKLHYSRLRALYNEITDLLRAR